MCVCVCVKMNAHQKQIDKDTNIHQRDHTLMSTSSPGDISTDVGLLVLEPSVPRETDERADTELRVTDCNKQSEDREMRRERCTAARRARDRAICQAGATLNRRIGASALAHAGGTGPRPGPMRTSITSCCTCTWDSKNGCA